MIKNKRSKRNITCMTKHVKHSIIEKLLFRKLETVFIVLNQLMGVSSYACNS